MPPKNLFSKQEVVDAALRIVREGGMAALTARALAQALGCSVKPIFGLFQGMEDVRAAVISEAQALYEQYLQTDMAAGKYPPYKASGMAYIRFAREEKELFKLLFMRDRRGEKIDDNREEVRPLIALICKNLGISEEAAYRFHLEMWVYVHGIATMIATDYLPWQEDFISDVITDAYVGLCKRYSEAQNGSDPNG